MSDALMRSAQNLMHVLTQENDALTRLDFKLAAALLPTKEAALADLPKHPRTSILLPPLALLGERLNALATQNQALLERAIAVQTRIVRIVARAGKPSPAATQYGGQNGRAPSHRAAAMALSTRA